jgi:hypothetical protein
MSTPLDANRPRAFTPGMETGIRRAAGPPGWDLATERRIDDGETLARMIGWFSIGLGVAEIAAPERLGDYLGMEDRTELIRLYGLREVTKGIGILSQRRPTNWMWARVAGDFLDLATLATALTPGNRKRERVVGAMLAVAGVTVLDVICAQQLSSSQH